MACTYRMKDAAGAWQTITGKPAMMAALADGRLDHLFPGGMMKAPAEAPASPRAAEYGTKNTLVSKERAAELRARLKAKLSQLNSGIDPEMLAIGAELAAFHIEAGVRKFADFVKAISSDLEVPVAKVRPYLRSWYNGARDMMEDSGLDVSGMDSPDTVRTELARLDAQPAPAAKSLRDSLYQAIKSGNMPKDNPALRKIVQEADGAIPTPARMKEAQEDLEAAIVMASRDIVAQKEGDRTTFDILLRLYESQPNLNIRTSASIDNQAYSTPAPLAFLTARLAGIGKGTTMYEPTAGNGMLTITAAPKNVTATELDGQRFGNLQALGVKVTQGDALKVEVSPKSVDAVHTNPPFGPIKNEKGESIKVKFDGYTLGQIDHLIAARALAAMKDDGKASLIIGANKAQGQMSNNDLIFFNWLYGNYNVTWHFEVNGDLYKRQGAGWPVRVITINGRAKSDRTAPDPDGIVRANTWSEVYEQFQKGMDSSRSATGGRDGAVSGRPARADDPRPVSVAADTEAGRPDSGRPEGGPARTGDVARAGARTVGDRRAVSDEPVGERNRDERPSDGPAVADNRQGATGEAGVPAKPAGNPRTADLKPEGNQFQSIYTARSSRKDEGVLIPVNMAGPTQDALNRLEDEVGDIDAFAAKELGYPSIGALHDAFMGLQVDSVASAIYQIKAGKGVIIADQTGIGKGRQAAGVIRWAAKNGKIPIFVTVKPSLFTDMYGDLADIGTSDIDPFILNADEWIKGNGDEKLFANKKALHKSAMTRIAESGELPAGRNALFMTYSQINTDNVQRRAVMALAPNAVFVLDESHNAGGDSGTGGFVRDALGLSGGVTYLSATYAKRPDNMPVYFKTDIGEASADDDSLMSAMSAGGLPLQTVVANNLVKAGQMFRRERSYDGVSIESRADTAHRAEHVELSNSTTLALRAIVRADSTFHANYVKSLQKELAKQGSRVLDMAGNQAKVSVDHTQFSSVVHNFVRQMLLGLKAQEAADDAVRSLKRGEKPLIAVENTMGSFLAEYAENNGLKVGDSLGAFDYRTVLSRALERSRYIIRQLPNGDKVKEYIPLNKLDPISWAAYESAQGIIDELEIDIPVSPIDWMRNEISKAGFSVAEVTGRNLSVDYSDPKSPKLSQLDALEQKDKVRTTRRFNAGELDALVLNVAGSTGISLHASEKFRDQRQRHMIVAQAAQDINIFMQMLGRIHRTGQVRLPKYTILTADLPAEIRPTALLSAKMKSLNANTSSNTESATSVKSADMLNKHGDQIVGQYLADNPELARDLGVEDMLSEEGDGSDDIARKATGRLALMPVKVQEQFYADVEEQYQALIDYLNKTNQNDLDPRTFDFDARETKSELLFEGQNKASPFGEDAFYNEFSIKAQGKAMTPDEIQAAMDENLGGKSPQQHLGELTTRLDAAYLSYVNKLEAEQASQAGQVRSRASSFLADHKIGSTFRVEINGDNYNAIVTNIRSTHKASGNPFSLSKFQVTIALNGALRSLTVPATQFAKIETSSLSGYGSKIDQLFKPGPTNERETAKIVTGNLLGAYGEIEGARGSIITFTKADGSTEQGILLPKTFNFASNVRQDYRLKTPDDALKFLSESKSENVGRFGISSRDGVVRVLPHGSRGIAIQVPKSKAKGGKFFLDSRLREHSGDFVSVGSSMIAYVPDAAMARAALDVLMQKQALYALPSMAEEARSIVGDAEAGSPAATQPSPGATEQPVKAPAAQVQPAEAIIEHRTQAGKTLRGIVRQGITKAQAQEIDPYTFKKDGGYFIREKHLKDDGAAPKFSRSSESASGVTHDTLPAIFARRFPKLASAVKTMMDRGTLGMKGGLVVIDSNKPTDIAREYSSRTGRDYAESVQMLESVGGESIHAFYDPESGLTFMVGPNLDEASLPAVILHEAIHGQQRQAVDAKAMALIKGRANEAPALRAFLDRVAERMEQVGEAGNSFEAASYIVEMAVTEGSRPGFSSVDGPILAWIEKNIGRKVADLVRDFVATVRAWGLAHGVPMKSLSVDDLVAYAMAGVGKAARGNVAVADSGVKSIPLNEPSASAGSGVQFSRAATLRTATQAATSALNETFSAPGKLSWWHKTVGTMYNLAERSPAFAPVFKAAQGFVDDVSHYANEAADMAPNLLPKLDAWRDIWKSPISAADNVAISKPVFEGTLLWGRDVSGRAVKVAELSAAAESLSVRQKADRLMGSGAISGNVHKMWQGLEVDQYEKNISTSYASNFLQAGIVWKPAELKSMFGLNDKQIELYKEFRRATDRSLDMMARADMLRYGGKDAKPMRGAVMNAPDVEAAAILLRDHFGELAQQDPEREDTLLATANAMMDRSDKVLKLQKQGYAPLSRFGRYTVDVVTNGERQYFGLYETAREANRAAGMMRQEFGADAVSQGTLSQEAFKLFAGITPETLELFGNALGLDSTGDEARDQAFQEYLRLTKSNRSAMKRMIHRQGIAGYSEDVARVLASFVYSNARQTAAGLNMGDLGEAVQAIPKEQGELKDVAFRLADYVKNPQEEAQAIRGLLFAQYLGGSIASAFVNMTQPAAVTFPWLSQFGGARAAASQLAKAAADMAKKRYEPDLARALHDAEEDGTVSPQEVHQLMAQAQGGGALRPGDGTKAGNALALASNGFRRMAFAWGKVFSMAEQVNRRVTFIAAYRTARAQGIANPEQFARKAVQETQFVYSKASKQQWGRGAVGGTLMTFKTYSIAYLELLHRMATQGGPEGKRAALLALGMLMLLGGAGGLPFAGDAEDVAEALARMLGYNISVKKARQELLEDAFGRDIAGFIDKGITGLPGMPLDVSGRLGMGNLIPGTGLLQPKTSHTSDMLEIVGPAGDLAKRGFSAAGKLMQGDVAGAALEASPVAARNLAKGADMAATGMYRDAKGYKVLDTNALEAALKAVGFQPQSVAKIQEANAEAQQAKNFYNLRAQEIRAKWAAGIFEQDPAKVQDARDEIADWNRKNPDQRMVIAIPSVMKRVKEMRKSKDERIAETAPKAMRAQMHEDFGKAREGL